MKVIMTPAILWQGDRIRCMKSCRTLQCNICMIERKEIMHRMKENRSKVINDNSDIFSSCKCGSRFHKFCRKIEPTLRTRMAQKKVKNSSRKSRLNRVSLNLNVDTAYNLCSPCSLDPETPNTLFGDIPESPQAEQLIDTNVPGILPYRSPNANPTNLELAQMEQYHNEFLVC